MPEVGGSSPSLSLQQIVSPLDGWLEWASDLGGFVVHTTDRMKIARLPSMWIKRQPSCPCKLRKASFSALS